MAIAGIPNNFNVQQGNGEVFLSWDLEAGALSYSVQRSLDGVSFTPLSTPTLNQYTDTAVTFGTQYYYQVASVNASGTSPYTAPQGVVPAPQGEMSLEQIRLAAKQRADRVNSNFVTLTEWNSYINQAMFELYDLLVTSYNDYFLAPPVSFQTNGSTFLFPLPNGVLTFNDTNNAPVIAQPLYKLMGVDLAINTNANNAFVTVNKFNFIDRNRFVYPNTSSTIYGVFNMQYRMMGDKIEFIPTPQSGQIIRLWYVPRLRELIKDNDITTIGFSGWIEYVIVRAAIYALGKEESDTSKLEQQILFLKQRIEESAMNRDMGQPDKISDIRGSGWWNGMPGGWGGDNGRAGW